MRRGFCRWLTLAVLLSVPLRPSLHAQMALHTRVFRTAGSYPSVVSVGPTGSVLSKAGDGSVLTWLDGFIKRDIPIPEEIIYRLHESRSGQIWSATKDGLLMYSGTGAGWTPYALPEIRAFLSTPSRQLRQVALLPAEVNRVLILFPDKLIDFEVSSKRTHLLKQASSTPLGEFIEIQEGLEDAVWVTGSYGVAKLEGPARRITADTPWTEFIVPDTNRIGALQRPYELPQGDLTCSANSGVADTREVVHLRDGQWTSFRSPDKKIRQAWRAWDDTVWGFSTTNLFRVNEESDGTATIAREPVSGALYDVAVETNGVFWVASSEGLIQYAPFLWRSPRRLENVEAPVQSILISPDGTNVWLSTPAGLIEQRGGDRRTYPWPEELENLPPRQVFLLPDGRVLIEGPDRPLVLENGKFVKITTPPASHVHLVGALKDGAVCAWFEAKDRETPLDLRLYRGERFESIDLPKEKWNRGEVTFVREGANGDLWICQGATLIRYRRSTGSAEHHGAENGLRTDRVFALGDVGEGRIWCGSAARIYEFRGQRWEPIMSTADRVTEITATPGNVWVSTLSGIHRFFDNSWLSYGTREGLPAGAVYSLRAGPNDKVWAGTARGAFVFHPDADPDPPRTFNPQFDEAQKPAAGEPLLIQFRAQDKWDYTQKPDLLFSYRLDEGGWSPYSNVTSHLFQKLSAGGHVLEVLAMDRNGNRAVTPGRLEFSVIVPWFKDPRLVSVSILALCSSLVLAGLAVNKHFQLKRSYARVEQMVEKRTRELEKANQELLHSQKMRALGTMAAGIAHDFNNILSIIKGSAQIIENNVQDPDKIRTRVGRIQMVVEQGTIIVKALLGLGKTEQKDLSDCDIQDLLHQTRKILSDRFPENVQFQIDAEEELPLVHCAPEVVQQILLNLILNAVEAMHNEGMVELRASVAKVLPPKPVLEPESPPQNGSDPLYILISVVDQGGGIPPENLPRIFEPFFTTKAFSTRRGTGLGLSMVYELAKAQGYGLAVETKVGIGSIFTIIIPVLRKRPSEDAKK